MATAATTETQSKPKGTAAAAGAPSPAVKRNQRRKSRAQHRKKMATRLQTEKDFAKAYFEGKSKRATDKKVAYRKKKNRKK